MRAFGQMLAVAALGLQTLPQRALVSTVIVASVAGVVATLLAALALAAGIRDALSDTGHADRVLVIRSGSTAEAASTLSRADVKVITEAPGIRHAAGVAYVSPEFLMSVRVPRRDSKRRAGVMLRGVTPQAFAVRSEVRIVQGRQLTPGLRELIVGQSAQSRYAGLGVGQGLWLRDGQWKVVGVFASGDSHESELWGDAETLLAEFGKAQFNAVTATLESPEALPGLRAALTSNPSLSVDVLQEDTYYRQQAREQSNVVYRFADVVGIIMALGAIFGAINTMYTAVKDRSTEIGTLRAIGFRPYCVAVATLFESLALSVLGALLGAALAWWALSGAITDLDGGSAAVAFRIHVSASLVLTGVLWAIVVGLVGGLPPALRASRLTPARVMKGL